MEKIRREEGRNDSSKKKERIRNVITNKNKIKKKQGKKEGWKEKKEVKYS